MAHCVVIGLGKLGACLAACLSEAGHTVIGIDINEDTVTAVNSGVAPVDEHGLQMLMDRYPFSATSDYIKGLDGADIAFIVLPTPSVPDGRFDSSAVLEALTHVAVLHRTGPKIAVVCSTVMPGTCERFASMMPNDVDIIYSPEFIAIGSVIDDMHHPDLVLIGQEEGDAGYFASDDVVDILSPIWRSSPQVSVLGWTEAELTKLAVNSFVTMKISFANNLTAICARHDNVDAAIVCDAVGADARIGKKYLKPGTAFGGPCFPRDSRAFRRAAEEVGESAWLALETDLENTRAVARLLDWCPAAGKVGILGLTYKAGTYLTEESAGVRLARALLAQGIDVYTYDPAATDITVEGGAHVAELPRVSTPVDSMQALNDCDAIVVTTPWDIFRDFQPEVPTFDCWGILRSASELITINGYGG